MNLDQKIAYVKSWLLPCGPLEANPLVPYLAKWLEHVEVIDDPMACWPWTGSTDRGLRGFVNVHAVAWAMDKFCWHLRLPRLVSVGPYLWACPKDEPGTCCCPTHVRGPVSGHRQILTGDL